MPILSDLEVRHTWAQAVKVILEALEPLGSQYCGALEKGLNNGWCDRYPNQGKQSGAFSSGTYDGEPYILMNYQPDVLDHVFTLAHEAGHSMHSYFSAKHQPLSILQLHDLRRRSGQHVQRAASQPALASSRPQRRRARVLINHDIDAIRGTIFRQTMFAEFEKIRMRLVESGEPLTVERVQVDLSRIARTAISAPTS